MENNAKDRFVDEVLTSLDGMVQAHTNEQLFNKIEQKLSLEIGGRVIPFRTVSLAAASILLLLAINILLLSQKKMKQAPQQDTIQQMVDYYGLNENMGL